MDGGRLMSSIPTNVAGRGDKRSPSPRKSPTEKVAGKLQPQTELHSHLEKTAKFIKAFDILVRVFAWLACMLAVWLLACFVDHWLLPIPSLLRWAIWLALVGFTGWIVIQQIVPLLVGKINLDYAARRIEHSEPQFKEGLIAWLQLSNMPDAGVPRGVMAALTYRAYRFIGGQDPSSTVDSSPLIRGLAGFLVLACVMALYSFVSPKSSLATGLRIAMPWRSTAPPTRVQLSDIEPGNTTVSSGKPLDVSVRATGVRNDEPVRLIFSTLDGQIVEGVVTLTEPDVGYIYTGQLLTTPTGVEHRLQYWIEAGDAVSEKYKVDLAPTPSVVLERVELVYPAYTGLAKQISDGRAIEAIEGTLATIVARSNQELKRGQLEINPTNSASGQLERADRLIEMQLDGRELTRDWPLLIGPGGVSPEEIQYSIRGYNARGDANLYPIVHKLLVVADVAPEIRLIGPKSRVLRVRPNTRLQLEIRASDPDYGLNEVELSVHKEGSAVASRKILVGDGLKGQQVKRQPLDIGRLKMQPGQRLELHATARDNRHDARTGKWSPNESHADPLIIEVVGPKEPADVSEAPEAGDDATDPSQETGGETAANGQSTTQSGTSGQQGKPPGESSPSQDSQPGNPQTQQPAGAPSNDPQNANSDQNAGGQNGTRQESSDAGGAQEQSGGENSESEQAGSLQTGASGGQSSTGSAGESDEPSGGSGQSDSQSDDGESSPNSGSQPSTGGNKPDSGSQTGSSNPRGGSSNQNSRESASPSSASPSANRRSGNQARAGASGSPASDADAMKQVKDFMRENQTKSQGKQSQQQKPGKSNSSQRPKGDPQSGNNQAAGDNQRGDPSKTAGPADSSSQQSQGGQTTSPDGQPDQDQSTGEGQNNQNPQNKSSADAGGEDQQAAQQGSTPDNKSTNSNGSGQEGQQTGDQQPGKQNGSGKPGQGQSGSQPDPGSSPETGNKQSDPASKSGEQSTGGSNGQHSGKANGNSKSSSSGSDSQGESKPGQGQQGKGESAAAGKQAAPSQETGQQNTEEQASSEKGTGKPGDSEGGGNPGGKGDENSAGQAAGKQASGQDAGKPDKATGEKVPDSNSEKQNRQPGEGAPKSGSQSASGQKSKPQSQAGGPPGSSKPGNNTGQVGNPTGSAGSSNRDGGGPGSAEAADRIAAERAADLVLDYLDRQREQPDPDLLREVNWDKNDLNNFVDRWKQARQLASQGDDDAQQKWKELLTELQLGSGRGGSLGPMKRNDSFLQVSDSATRMEPPKALLKRWEAVQRALKDR